MDSDLQLNIKTISKKPKQKHNVNKLGGNAEYAYSFVAKPIMEGKTIAKKRKKPPAYLKKESFSFITNKRNESIEKDNAKQIGSEIVSSKHSKAGKSDDTSQSKEMITQKRKEIETKDDDDNMMDTDLSINVKTTPVVKKKQQDKGNRTNDEEYQHSKPAQGHSEVKKRSILSHISSLFRNNPEVPKLGQRLVKPINEKIFSGKTFQDLDIHSFSVANLEKNMGLKQMTVVQQKACPVMLQGRDVLVRSQTGSGKTLAYALPIVEALQAIRPKLTRSDGIKALVIVPSRELAIQTYELFIKLVRSFTWIVPGYLIGGENRKAEKARIRKGFNILIGTPGRICDHIQHTASLSLGKVRCLILDEADRLLDMGYEKDVSSIVETLKKHEVQDKYDPLAMVRQSVNENHKRFSEDDNEEDEADDSEKCTPEKSSQEIVENYKHPLSNVFLSDKRQTVLLSATLTKAVETLAGLTMEDPVFIDASEDRATLVADSLATKSESCTSERIEKIQSAKVNESESDVNEDFEIVPQEDSSEESDESGESDKDEGDSVKTSDSSSDDEKSEIDKSKLEVYKGLKAFGGIQSPQKEKNKKRKEKADKTQESVVQSKNKMKLDEKSAKATDEGSDSDSDYDFFAVSKVDIKISQADKSEKKHTEEEAKPDTKILTQSGNYENPFQNALQNAIVQDEMVIPSSVTQIYILAPMKLRLITLSALIIERCVTPGSGKMLVFMATQDMIDYHCEILSRVLAGRKPHHIHIEDNNKYSKRNKKYSKHKDTSAEESHDKQKDKESDKSKETEDAQNESKDSGDEYEYKFDSMDLADYEAKMRAEKAFVDVDFFQLHGSMNQKTRTEIFNTFRKANSGVLLCTSAPLKEHPNPETSNCKQMLNKELRECKKKMQELQSRLSVRSRSNIRKQYTNVCNRIHDLKKQLKNLKNNDGIPNSDTSVSDRNTTANLANESHAKTSTSSSHTGIDYYDISFYKLEESEDELHNKQTLEQFYYSRRSVLFCTDVAARGLDLPHVDCIVQYTGPISVTDYVHRVGRTARAGNVGVAIMILLPSELEFVKQLEARRIRLYQEDMEVSHKALLRNSEDRNKNSKSGGPSAVQVAAATLQQNYEELVKSDQQLYTKACKAFTSWLRFYSTYPREAREAFDRTALHIGHAATALALTDTPKKIGREAPKPVNRKDSDLKRRAEKEKKLPKMAVKARRRERKMIINEFDSGLEPSKKKSRYH